MVITSIDNKIIKEFKKLEQKKYRDLNNLFLIEGKHLIEEAYKTGYLQEIIVSEYEQYDLDIKTTIVSPKVINYLSSLENNDGIIGICRKLKNNEIGNNILLLDNIQDPGNLGTIIRSAVAFNINTIILGKGTVDLYNPKVLRSTQGLIFKINIIETDLLEIILKLKKDNYKIIGTDVNNGSDLKEYSSIGKYALIMGNEGHGLSNEIKSLCDDYIYIKLNKECESLNVGIACSIILYQLNKE